jgi:hypothetical protein
VKCLNRLCNVAVGRSKFFCLLFVSVVLENSVTGRGVGIVKVMVFVCFEVLVAVSSCSA